MKKYFLLAILIMGFNGLINAQFRVGLKFGVSSDNITTTPINIHGTNDFSDLKLSLLHANYGIHAGIFTQVKILGIFIQPEFIFNSSSADYKLTQITHAPVDIIKRESYQNLDIPVLMGVKFGPLQLGVGPVGHVFINSTSELFDVSGYKQKFKELKYGYQAGAALVIGKLYLDVRYEGNLSKFGDHLEFFGKQYAFDKSPSRIMGSIGIAF
jgi:Outer membrane protein beta-barrel domain